jgi:hypothetical protein
MVTPARVSGDELEIMYSANPPGCVTESCADLFYARRDSLDAGFPSGNPIPGPNVSVPNFSEYWPTMTKDSLVLYFESDRPPTILPDGGGSGAQPRIWTATRTNPLVDFQAPYLLEAFKNIPGPEGNPYVHPNGRSLYFISAGRGGAGALDIFVASFDPLFGVEPRSVTPVVAVNSIYDEYAPVLTFDEKTMYFARDDKTYGLRQIYRTARVGSPDGGSGLGTPVLVPELNSPLASVEDFPSAVSLDECRIYFVSNRPLLSETGDAGSIPFRLWVASRPK